MFKLVFALAVLVAGCVSSQKTEPSVETYSLNDLIYRHAKLGREPAESVGASGPESSMDGSGVPAPANVDGIWMLSDFECPAGTPTLMAKAFRSTPQIFAQFEFDSDRVTIRQKELLTGCTASFEGNFDYSNSKITPKNLGPMIKKCTGKPDLISSAGNVHDVVGFEVRTAPSGEPQLVILGDSGGLCTGTKAKIILKRIPMG